MSTVVVCAKGALNSYATRLRAILNCQRTSALDSYSRRESLPGTLSAPGSRDKQFALDDKRTSWIKGWLGPMVLYPMIPIMTEKVNSQTIGRGIDDLQESLPNSDYLRRINKTFKNGILHTLSIVQTSLGDPAQPAPTLGSGRGDIVGDQDLHLILDEIACGHFQMKAG
jgi:hypothetical protein